MTSPIHHRGVVMPWECDNMGHLNIRYYLARYAQALKHRAATAGGRGAPPRRLDRVQFRHEARAGWNIACELGGDPADPAAIVGQLVHPESGQVLARFDSRLREASRPVDPDWLRDEGPVEFPTAIGAPEVGPQREADLAPLLTGWVSDANALSVAALAGDSDYRLYASPIGFVVAELTLVYAPDADAAPAAFSIDSALLAQSRRSLTLRHVIRDAGSRSIVAAARVACVFFSRETRSAVPLPFVPVTPR